MNEQVFISHSSTDDVWTSMIAKTLEENGIRCWFDVHSIRPGDDYDKEIFEAIRRCPIFLLVLTENAVEATFVIKELGLAIREHKTIIPVKIGEFDLGKFWLKLENVQIYELGKSWNAQKMAVLTDEIKVKLDLVPIDMDRSQPPQKKPKGNPAWLKWAVVACIVVVLGGIAATAIRAFSRKTPNPPASGEENIGATFSQSPEDMNNLLSQDPEDMNASLSQSPEDTPGKNQTIALSKLQMMESDYAEVRDEAVNSVGQTSKDAVYMCSIYFGPPYASYYLGGEYSLFTGTLSCPDEVGSGYTYTFQVCLDGNEDEPVFEIEMGRSTAPTPLEIDVSGCQTITFRTVGESCGAMISDGLLTP